MTVQSLLIIMYKICVSLILYYIGFTGLTMAIYTLATGASFSKTLIVTGVTLMSILFIVMAVQHNFRPVAKLLKITVLVFGVFLFVPCIFSIGALYPNSVMFWLRLITVFYSIFLIPIGLVYISNRLNLKFVEA